MPASLHMIIDVSSADLSEKLRREAHTKLSRENFHNIALTVLGTPTTSNLLSNEGLEGYEHIHTIHELGSSSSTAVLDSLKNLGVGHSETADLLSALVVAVYGFTWQRQQQKQQADEARIFLLCDASLFTQDADGEDVDDDLEAVLEPMHSLSMHLAVASTSPLPETGVLRALSDALGERFEFSLIEGGEGGDERVKLEVSAHAPTAAAAPAASTADEVKYEVEAEVKAEAKAEAKEEAEEEEEEEA